MPGDADYLHEGDWDFICDLCGRKAKASTGVKTWDGFYVCRYHKESRNPQDYLRGVRDNQSVPWSRPRPPDSFLVSNFFLTQLTGSLIILQNPAFLGELFYLLH